MLFSWSDMRAEAPFRQASQGFIFSSLLIRKFLKRGI